MKNEAERDKKEAAEQEKLFQLERFRKQAEQMESFHRAEVGKHLIFLLSNFFIFLGRQAEGGDREGEGEEGGGEAQVDAGGGAHQEDREGEGGAGGGEGEGGDGGDEEVAAKEKCKRAHHFESK